MSQLTMASLFDGAGTAPFAGQYLGIKVLWTSEIEPFPLTVEAKHFPDVKRLGDVTKINGAEVEPVDILVFGAPCQDVSVAGKRKGLRHESLGDKETSRSGLFIEAVRIAKEMYDATNGRKPTVLIYENVPGMFSSRSGEDFRTVLESLCRIKDETAVVPRPASKWSECGGGVGRRIFHRLASVGCPALCTPTSKAHLPCPRSWRSTRRTHIV